MGLRWNPNDNYFNFSVDVNMSHVITKRQNLSTISKIFDPLGLTGPVTVIAKLILQRLWQSKADWDESLLMDIHTTWQHFRQPTCTCKRY